MNSHIIGLAGQAGSGKDTVGNYIAKTYGGVTLGQADPLKRFVRDVFGFSEEQLWGPSEKRNAVDPRFLYLASTWPFIAKSERHYFKHSKKWLRDVLPELGELDIRKAQRKLTFWLEDLLTTFRLNPEKLTPRLALQTLGTGWGREFSKDMWINYAANVGKELLRYDEYKYSRTEGLVQSDIGGAKFVIITDIRFANEIDMVHSNGGLVFRIDRRANLSAAAGAAGIQNHISEKELGTIPDGKFDAILKNNGTLFDLFFNVSTTMENFYKC